MNLVSRREIMFLLRSHSHLITARYFSAGDRYLAVIKWLCDLRRYIMSPDLSCLMCKNDINILLPNSNGVGLILTQITKLEAIIMRKDLYGEIC